jgi:hypothetical protein
MMSVLAMSGDGLALSWLRAARALQMLLLLADATFASSCTGTGSNRNKSSCVQVQLLAALHVA